MENKENIEEKLGGIKDIRNAQISVRMKKTERMLIKMRAKEFGLSMSQYMVKCSIGKEIKMLSEEEKKAYIDLAKYHSNFSRIKNLLNNGNYPELINELNNVMAEIKNQLQKMQKNDK